MTLTRLAVTRPLTILMLILALGLMGAVAYSRMRADRLPTMSYPNVFVRLAYPGASPADVEELVTRPVEDAMAGLSGIQTINSTSSEELVSFTLGFVEGTDTERAALDVERQIAAVRSSLPDEVGAAWIRRGDPSGFPVMNVAMSGPQTPAELFDLGDNVVLPRLRSVPGVADVLLVGGLQREVQVRVDAQRLRAYGISLQTVQQALERENVSDPSGRLDQGPGSRSVRTQAVLRSADDLRALVVQSTPMVVRLQDVATVVDTFADPVRIQRYNGQESVGFIITKQPEANSIDVADNLRAAIVQLERTLPRGVTLAVTSDAAIFTRRSLSAVLGDLNIAVLLTGVVLLVFLHTWRSTLIVMLAIPTSLISTFLVMYVAGFSLNMSSLMALALSIGILVDDSIVVLENITRHLEQGAPPREAALKGRGEIGMAAIAITLVDVIVFLPVSFTTGNVGRLFKEFGITIAAATLLSLLVSFTLTPMLASRWLKAGDQGRGPLTRFGRFWDRGYGSLAALYCRTLAVGLRLRWLVVAFGAATLYGSLLLIQLNLIGSEYVPSEDDGQFTVFVAMPPGTSLQGTDTATKRVELLLRQIPEVDGLFASVGTTGGLAASTPNSERNAAIAVQLVEKAHRQRSVFEVLAEVRRAARQVPEAQVRAAILSPLSGGGSGGSLSIRLFGDDLSQLTTIADRVTELVRATPGAADVQNETQRRDPEVRAVLDRERLADLRQSAGDVARVMRTMVGGTVVTQLRTDGQDQVNVRLVGSDADRASARQLGATPLLGQAGTTVRLDQVAQLIETTGPASIQRTDRQRVIQVSANVAGRSLGDVTAGGLYLTGNTFNVFSLIGMVMLMGLVGKNAILLVDFVDTLRERGLSRTEAILEAARTRLRPILMTTATVVFGMFPLTLKLEEGAETRAPMAVVILGGVLSSTLLTLVLVPAVYTILDDAKVLVGRLVRRLAGPNREDGAPATPEPAASLP
jgi:HAE1 family hydrophobic/amphiphilic exporter-1